MIGTLPTSLNVNGKAHPIRSDYRNILTIFTAFSDESLTDEDKLYLNLSKKDNSAKIQLLGGGRTLSLVHAGETWSCRNV